NQDTEFYVKLRISRKIQNNTNKLNAHTELQCSVKAFAASPIKNNADHVIMPIMQDISQLIRQNILIKSYPATIKTARVDSYSTRTRQQIGQMNQSFLWRTIKCPNEWTLILTEKTSKPD
ncbi:hypothetical protein ACJMK2_028491, partial [Sinanodonta woodiana]